MFAGLQAEDWPRWRETKLMSDWQIGPNFKADNMLLTFQVLTPKNDRLYDLTNLLPPALIWDSPMRWKVGETIHLTTLPLYLPRAWGVVLSLPPDAPMTSHLPHPLVMSEDRRLALTGVYLRSAGDQLIHVPDALFTATDFGTKLGKLAGIPVTETSSTFHSVVNETIKLQVWLPHQPLWPGATLNLWLQWRGHAWPDGMQVFVHVRQDNQNKAQIDGMPRYFVAYAVNAVLQTSGFANDWRQLTIPADATATDDWTVVIGLYNPQTGQRADVLDANGHVIGNEWVIGHLQLGAPPVPDQACALIPQTCAAQLVP